MRTCHPLAAAACAMLAGSGLWGAQFPRPGRKASTWPPAVVRHPSAKTSVDIGNFYLRRKEYRGALSRFKEAVRTDPDYAPAYLGLGKAYDKMGFSQEALTDYQKYLDNLDSQRQADRARSVHRAILRLKRQMEANKSEAAKYGWKPKPAPQSQ